MSVPDPDISLHFLIRRLKIPNQVPKNLIRHPSAGRISIACPVAFLKQNNRVGEALSFSVKTSGSRCKVAACARSPFGYRHQSQPKRTCKRTQKPAQRLGTAGRLHGDIAQGTARALYTPAITHPAEHTSHETIGYSLDWFSRTLQGGMPRRSDDQIRFAKEIGTLIALAGFVALLIGVFDGLLKRPSHLRWPEITDGTMPAHVAF
ncbi:MAG TPA: hypothetical protein VNS33_20455 [Bradyrhizobium sp.]|nr:hypothetical protein [Bradyrhizobium sp.]